MYGDIKIALIYGDKSLGGINYDGIIETITIDDEASHIEYLINFFKTHPIEDEYLRQNIQGWTANQVGLYLREQGHIVFMNVTSYKSKLNKNTKKEGIFMIPDEPTKKQLNGLENFKDEIKDYHSIQIWKNFYVDEYGCLACSNMTNENYDLSCTDLLDIFIKQNQKVK